MREKKCWSEKRAYRVIKRVRVRERERSTKLFVTL